MPKEVAVCESLISTRQIDVLNRRLLDKEYREFTLELDALFTDLQNNKGFNCDIVDSVLNYIDRRLEVRDKGVLILSSNPCREDSRLIEIYCRVGEHGKLTFFRAMYRISPVVS